MRAAIVERLGEVPRCVDMADPTAADGRVVARVRAAAIKNIERMLVAGTHYGSRRMQLPAGVGMDAVVDLPDGRRVYAGATPPAGAMAERLVVDPGQAVEIPDGVDDAAAAALPNAAVSAWFALEYAGRIRSGQRVLILGATGVTGGLAVQLAKHRFGAGEVVAVGRNAERLARLCERGADATIQLGGLTDDTLREAVLARHAERPFDLVIDYLWGEPAEQTLRAFVNEDLGAVFHRIRFVQVGETAGATIELPAAALRSAGVELVGQGAGSVPREAFARVGSEIVPELFRLMATGELALETVRRPLAQVSEAWTEPVPSGSRTVLIP